MDVAIIGVGKHRFGRSPELSGVQQGAEATRKALEDAGLDWKQMEFAYGGSQDAGNADAMVNELGLTGLQFTNIWNGCATGGSSLHAAYTAIKSGEYDIGAVVGFDKHPPGAFNPTQFFAMKIQRYMHDYDITNDSLIRVAEKAFYNGSLNPTAWRQQALSYNEIAESAMISEPLRKYMFCSPAEGGIALILCNANVARRYTSKPLYLKAAAVRSRQFGSFEVFSPSQALEVAASPTVTASKAAFELSGLGPEDCDVLQLQDTEAGHY